MLGGVFFFANGACRSIFTPDGPVVGHPVMQCVQIRPMEPKSGEANPVQRFRVVFSDIKNFIQTMIATGMRLLAEHVGVQC